MKVEFNSSQFNDFIKKSKIIKDTSGGILIEATDTVRIIKCDSFNQVELEISANIIETGQVIIPKSVIKLIKDNERMTITKNKIIVGKREINFTEDEKEYPRISGDFNKNIFEMHSTQLKTLLEVEHAISTDKTKPILCGVRIQDSRFIAIDGYRFSERIGDFKTEKDISVTSIKMLKALRGDIKATCSDKHIRYQVGDYNFYDSIIEGAFIEIDKLKPKEYNTEVVTDKKILIDILSTISDVSSKVRNNLVVLHITDGHINIETKAEKIEVKDSFNCQTKGEDLNIGFNCRYLLESLKSIDDDFTIQFTSCVNPVVIKSKGKYELVLPVRIASGI